jgi:hypothetical protein
VINSAGLTQTLEITANELGPPSNLAESAAEVDGSGPHDSKMCQHLGGPVCGVPGASGSGTGRELR